MKNYLLKRNDGLLKTECYVEKKTGDKKDIHLLSIKVDEVQVVFIASKFCDNFQLG